MERAIGMGQGVHPNDEIAAYHRRALCAALVSRIYPKTILAILVGSSSILTMICTRLPPRKFLGLRYIV